MKFNIINKTVIPCIIASTILISGIAVSANSNYYKVGSQGEDVKIIQTKLSDLGFFSENVTGYYGEVTKEAVMAYQKANGFSVDGIVGPATWQSLVGSNTANVESNLGEILKVGSENENVKKVQNKLKELGFFSENVTGYYGEVTKEAVMAYQRANGFTADGIVGSSTWDALMNGLSTSNVSYSRVLKVGIQGDDVTKVQSKLKQLGYFTGEITGYFGEETKSAVMAYQRADEVEVDGIVGPATWSDLFDESVSTSTTSIPTMERVLKKGIRGEDVKKVQTKLKELGYFSANNTGAYASITQTAVENFQTANGLTADGIVGEETWNKIFSKNSISADRATVSRGNTSRDDAMLSWSKASTIFKIGTVATITDVKTGTQFKIKRTYGTNHADCEALTSDDAAKIKQTFGGEWSWNRRAIVVNINGQLIAASMNGMPHAGLDWAAAGKTVSGRSGGYGTGYNYDTIKDNGMNGHICVHFYQSKTHGTGKVDSQHQNAVKVADDYIKNN